MKKVKSNEILTFQKRRSPKQKTKSPNGNIKEENNLKFHEKSEIKSSGLRSKTFLFHQLRDSYHNLEDQYYNAVEEIKHRSFLFQNQKKELEKMKNDHENNLKQIQRLKRMTSLIKKKDQSSQVNMNFESKGSWFTRQKTTEGEGLEETRRDPWLSSAEKKKSENGYRTLYKESSHNSYNDLVVRTTLERISKKKKLMESDLKVKSKKKEKCNEFHNSTLQVMRSPKKVHPNLLEFKRLTNSPYSQVKVHNF